MYANAIKRLVAEATLLRELRMPADIIDDCEDEAKDVELVDNGKILKVTDLWDWLC